MSMSVVGVDGCRAGWCYATFQLRDLGIHTIDLNVARRFEDVLAKCERAQALAVDIPIGLPSVEGYPRACDQTARKLLGQKRGCSVFYCPPREIVYACAEMSFERASAFSRRNTGKGLPQQTYSILDKIKQVDSCVTTELQKRVFEVHPETCFWVLNRKRPLTHSKKGRLGFEERMGILEDLFLRQDLENLLNKFPRKEVGRDDVVDGLVAAYAAKCYVEGKFTKIPEIPANDSQGLRMEMIMPA